MKRNIISVLTAAALLLLSVTTVGCEESLPEGADYSFDCALSGNPESLDPQFASDLNSMNVIQNMFTGLMKIDENGNLKEAAAKKYDVSADGLKYTFTLRNDCFWFYDANDDDKIDNSEVTPVTAYDFEFAFRRMFNPETVSPHREKYLCLKKAGLIISGAADFTELGVWALNDNELVFELEYPCADFLYSLTFTAAMPCNEKFFNDTKGRYGLDDKSIASNGSFFIRQWFYDPYGKDNFIYMKRNSKNGVYDRIYPSYLNFYIKKSVEEVAESFDEGVSDVLMTFNYDEKKFNNDEVKSFFNYTLGIIINPANEQYSNTNIKKAIAYGIDKESFDGQLPEDMSAAYAVIPPGVSFLGKKYREINSDKLTAKSNSDNSQIQYDPDKALEFFETGMTQMNLKSIENVKLLVSDSFMNTDYLHLITQNWQTLFGFYIGIEEVPIEEYYSRIRDGEYDMAIYPLTGNYNNPVSVLEQFSNADNDISYANSSLNSVVDQIKKLKNYEDGIELYSQAENIIINDFDFIPVFYKKEFQIMGAGNHDIFYDPFTKLIDFRHAKYYD